MDGNLAYIAAVAGIGSAIGGLIGTLATMWIAKKQIHAKVILAERMKWIATLRDSISQFVGAIDDVNRYNANLSVSMLEQAQAAISQAGVLHMKIDLLLNPKEDDHIALGKFLAQAFLNIRDKTVGGPNILANITTMSQEILKREWERVKKGD